MNKPTNWVKSAANLCYEFGEEDGVAPKLLARKQAHKPQTQHKMLQLCKETRRIVSLVIAEMTNRPLLCDLQVVSVLPEANGQDLCVTLAHDNESHCVTEKQVIAELKTIQGVLRCALAQAINRKKTPLLTFRYAGVMTQGGG